MLLLSLMLLLLSMSDGCDDNDVCDDGDSDGYDDGDYGNGGYDDYYDIKNKS